MKEHEISEKSSTTTPDHVKGTETTPMHLRLKPEYLKPKILDGTLTQDEVMEWFASGKSVDLVLFDVTYQQNIDEYIEFGTLFVQYCQDHFTRDHHNINEFIASLNKGIQNRIEFLQFICRNIYGQISRINFILQTCLVFKSTLLKENTYIDLYNELQKSFKNVSLTSIEKLKIQDANQFLLLVEKLIQFIFSQLDSENSDNVQSKRKNAPKRTLDMLIIYKPIEYIRYAGGKHGSSPEYECRFHPLFERFEEIIKELTSLIRKKDKSILALKMDQSKGSMIVPFKQESSHVEEKTVGFWNGLKSLVLRNPIEANLSIFTNEAESDQNRANAALNLATLSVERAKKTIISQESEFETLNIFIQAGIYLEMYFSLKFSWDREKSPKFDGALNYKLKDGNGSYWYINFYNRDLVAALYPNIVTVTPKPFEIDDLLRMRNSSIEISILDLYLKGDVRLSFNQYSHLAAHHSHYVADFLVDRVAYQETDIPRHAYLEKFPQIHNILITRIRFKHYAASFGNTKEGALRQQEHFKRILDHLEKIKFPDELITEEINAKVEEEVNWFSWAVYNKNKFLSETQPLDNNAKRLNDYIRKYKEHPLAVFNYQKPGVQITTVSDIRKRYKQQCLIYSPDKRINSSETADEKSKNDNIWYKLQDAYTLLSDSTLFKLALDSFQSSPLSPELKNFVGRDEQKPLLITDGSEKDKFKEGIIRRHVQPLIEKYKNSWSVGFHSARRSYKVDFLEVIKELPSITPSFVSDAENQLKARMNLTDSKFLAVRKEIFTGKELNGVIKAIQEELRAAAITVSVLPRTSAYSVSNIVRRIN